MCTVFESAGGIGGPQHDLLTDWTGPRAIVQLRREGAKLHTDVDVFGGKEPAIGHHGVVEAFLRLLFRALRVYTYVLGHP